MLLNEKEQLEREEYLKKYGQLVNIQERERQMSAKIRQEAEKLAKTIIEDRVATEHKQRLNVQNKLKILEESNKKQEETYLKNIQRLQDQLYKEEEFVYRLAQYIADNECIGYGDDEEMIANVDSFVTEKEIDMAPDY